MKTATESTITIHGKSFRPLISAERIAEAVSEMGARIAADYSEPPLLVCVLKGSYLFTADLARAIPTLTETDFIQVSSYVGTKSTGQVTYKLDLASDITGRHVIVVEDILDTGTTLNHILSDLTKRNPASLEVAVLAHKTEATKYPIHPKYVGFTIPNHFVLGYGLDYDEHGRNLPDIYILND